MKIVRLRSGADAILTALPGCIPRGSDHGDRGDRARACRFPLEGGAVSVCSTKTRTAALRDRGPYPVLAINGEQGAGSRFSRACCGH
jgi:hypothetical protein